MGGRGDDRRRGRIRTRRGKVTLLRYKLRCSAIRGGGEEEEGEGDEEGGSTEAVTLDYPSSHLRDHPEFVVPSNKSFLSI